MKTNCIIRIELQIGRKWYDRINHCLLINQACKKNTRRTTLPFRKHRRARVTISAINSYKAGVNFFKAAYRAGHPANYLVKNSSGRNTKTTARSRPDDVVTDVGRFESAELTRNLYFPVCSQFISPVKYPATDI